HVGAAEARDRRGADEPRGRRAARGDEGGIVGAIARGRGRGVRRVLSVSRRPRRDRERGRDRRRAPGRLGTRRRGRRGGRRARPRGGRHGPAALPALRMDDMTQRGARWWALIGAIVIGIFAHSFIPRYEWRPVNANGTALVAPYAANTRDVANDRSVSVGDKTIASSAAATASS